MSVERVLQARAALLEQPLPLLRDLYLERTKRGSRVTTYLGEDDKETCLTTSTVSYDNKLSAKFRHGSSVCIWRMRREASRTDEAEMQVSPGR